MALILSIETSGTNCSVAISKNGQTITLKETNDEGFVHGEKLHLYIDEILKKQNIHPKKLNAIAVSQGPGSYTGLRIGVASAKGLCFALNIPLIAIPTLQILASELFDNKDDKIIIPMLDARRMEAYACVYNQKGILVEPALPVILTKNSFEKYKNKKTIFLGNGSDKFKNIHTLLMAEFIPKKFPSAAQMGAIAFEKYAQKQFENIAHFEPSYLK